MHPALQSESVAVITGAASGLGLAAAHHLSRLGMRICLADVSGGGLATARAGLIDGGASPDSLITVQTDVADPAQITALADRAYATFGAVNLLMNNAGIQPGSSIFDAEGRWDHILAVNLFGVIHGAQIFAPRMIAGGQPGLIINTGSKQGITTPPGDPAYNISKAGIKVFTEALQHHLRGLPDRQIEAKLFIPGFVFTALTANGRTERPTAAWTPEQTVDFLFDAVDRGDFYILCPDNDVDRRTDEKRILWAAGDLAQNRPPLSRWHGDYAEAFKDWLES